MTTAAPDDDVMTGILSNEARAEGLRLIQMVRCEIGKRHMSLDLVFQCEKVERLLYELPGD